MNIIKLWINKIKRIRRINQLKISIKNDEKELEELDRHMNILGEKYQNASYNEQNQIGFDMQQLNKKIETLNLSIFIDLSPVINLKNNRKEW